ncbi:hypothetical protein [Delftia acidovorans]|uniref:hypothetical protein n=1 Tax=Delftia acidovorans TaxID=80866 RepID=UPI00241D354D|nr:hypothetical protein [Delftia acidovorans]
MNRNNPLVLAALNEVAALRLSEFCGNETSICRLLHEYGEGSNLPTLLWQDLLPQQRYERAEDVRDLLALWVWKTPDNGTRIRSTLDTWLQDCNDQNKVWIALHREGVPFSESAEIVQRVARSFPALAKICADAISNRYRPKRY